MKLYNIDVCPELVKKVIFKLDSAKALCSWLYSSGGSEEMWAWT